MAAAVVTGVFQAHKRLRAAEDPSDLCLSASAIRTLRNSHHLRVSRSSTTAVPQEGLRNSVSSCPDRFQTFAESQSLGEDSKVKNDSETLKSEKRRVKKSVQHDESRPPRRLSRRLRTAEEFHLDAGGGLYPSHDDVTRDEFPNLLKQTTELSPDRKIRTKAKKAGHVDGAEAMHLDKIQGLDASKESSLGVPLQPELVLDQDSETNMTAQVKRIETYGDLSQQQKMRMELNKAAALAKRNLRICEGRIADAQARGLPFPKFESLLVEEKWLEAIRREFQKPYMESLHRFISQEAAGRIPIYPPPAKIFSAFNSSPFDKVKVVIIGQDPFHGPGQATGLCFSVENESKFPASLVNIFKEIRNDFGCSLSAHGNLEKWAHQGVLLLNTVLTVRDNHANSHAKKGWEPFTDAAIRLISQQRSGVVFLLWGTSAQEKIRLINKTTHHILKAGHPSDISGNTGFLNCRHFSRANKILEDQGLLPINWQL